MKNDSSPTLLAQNYQFTSDGNGYVAASIGEESEMQLNVGHISILESDMDITEDNQQIPGEPINLRVSNSTNFLMANQ